MDMGYSTVQLTDLPDEILLMIFKNIDNVQLLYSMMGVNTRLDRTIYDPVFTRHLTLFRYLQNRLISPLSEMELRRFCSQILPEIHHKIHTLHVESSTMERALLAVDYPNLHQLALYNIDNETAERVFAGEKSDIHFSNNVDREKERKRREGYSVYSQLKFSGSTSLQKFSSMTRSTLDI